MPVFSKRAFDETILVNIPTASQELAAEMFFRYGELLSEPVAHIILHAIDKKNVAEVLEKMRLFYYRQRLSHRYVGTFMDDPEVIKFLKELLES